jgi:hypothetical protein
MAQPVWVLSVDLQAKTATFASGMADAAKGARGSFNDIKSGAAEMGASTSGSMMEARHGVMLLGEEFGVHLPRALTSFIASIGPIGAAMEAAFPFLAIIVGATLLLQHLAKLRAEGEKLTESQVQFGTTVANVLNGLNDKLLESGIRTDELNGNHLAALNKQLQLIDHQSMQELVRAFDTVAKAADVTFAQLKTSWYQWSAGSAGAKNSLEQFKAQYDSLIAQGDAGAEKAKELLDAKIEREQRILTLQKESSRTTAGPSGAGEADAMKFYQARTELKKLGVGYDEKEVAAQETLVAALQSQVNVQEKVKALKESQSSNAVQVTETKTEGDSDKMARAQAQSAKQAADDAQKLWEENYKRAVSALQESEREKIEATQHGSAARLAVIDAAIKEEQSKGLQETGFYKSLLTDRVNTARQLGDEEKKLSAESKREDADATLKMAELEIAAKREAGQMKMAQTRMNSAQQLEMELGFAAQEHAAKQQALNADIAALDRTDKEYENKKKALNDKLLQLDRQFHNQEQIIEDQAQKKRLADLQTAETRAASTYAQGFSKVIMGKQSFAQMMAQTDSQMAQKALENLIMSAMQRKGVQGTTRFEDARTAAADAWASAGNPFLGAIEAAGAFASVMAFASGGLVPGVGVGDVVPAMLTPGETVIPKNMTEKLSRASDSDSGGRRDIHVHVNHSPTIHALDAENMDRVLQKNSAVLTQHFHRELRKMNR